MGPHVTHFQQRLTAVAEEEGEDSAAARSGNLRQRQLPLVEEIQTGHRDRLLLVRCKLQSSIEHPLGQRSIFGNVDNLVVNPPPNQWQPYAGNSSLDDVMDGTWYRKTCLEYFGVDPLQMLASSRDKNGHSTSVFFAPLLLYGDKTGTDIYQRYALEPFVVTLGIIRRAVHYHPWAW